MDYIYHYTTLSSLISMISNNQLRLMRLDKFLNLYDSEFPINVDTFGLCDRIKNIYVSSWINDPYESLAKWKLFSNLEDGIRIGINIQQRLDESNAFEINEIHAYSSSLLFNETMFQIKVPENNVYVEKVSIIGKEELSSFVKFKELSFNIEEFNKQLEFSKLMLSSRVDPIPAQNEIRLQVNVIAPRFPYRERDKEEYERKMCNDDFIHHISVSLPDNFFNDCEILLSPNFTKEGKMLLQSFLSGQGFNVQVKESSFTNRWKQHMDDMLLYKRARNR